MKKLWGVRNSWWEKFVEWYICHENNFLKEKFAVRNIHWEVESWIEKSGGWKILAHKIHEVELLDERKLSGEKLPWVSFAGWKIGDEEKIGW